MLRRSCEVVRYSSALASIIYLAGCSSPDLKSVRTGEKAIVLLRIDAIYTKQKPGQPVRHSSICFKDNFGLGDFESGGKPDPTRGPKPRYLSKASQQGGWLYFVLPHGSYYLAVYPSITAGEAYEDSLTYAPSWHINIKEDVKLAYVGTLRFPAESERLLFGGRMINYIDYSRMIVKYEYGSPNELAAQFFSEFGEIQTALMKRKKGPYILSAPLPPLSK
jgi:hypothetical protein